MFFRFNPRDALNERIPFSLFLQHHPETLFPLTRHPSLRLPACPRRANDPSAGKGTRRGWPSPGGGYWAETRLCRVLIPGWWPFMLGSWTSAPAPWCPPAGSCLPLTASSASTIVAFAFFSMLCLQLAGVAVAAAFTVGTFL